MKVFMKSMKRMLNKNQKSIKDVIDQVTKVNHMTLIIASGTFNSINKLHDLTQLNIFCLYAKVVPKNRLTFIFYQYFIIKVLDAHTT